ncbi:MAG: D-aminoacylase [Acidimicrobiia bacterium]|nr:D-aminoacylase [Acidimicrobiia bacterium]
MSDTLAKSSLAQSNSRREFLLKSAALFGVATMAGADDQLVALPTLNQRVSGREPAFDVLIRNGRVIDGTGSPVVLSDVAIAGDKIVAVGKLEGAAKETIDATGLVVTPGFIDLHTHSDFQFFIDSTADSKIMDGVTLELVGNCGFSFCGPLLGKSREDIDTRIAWYPTNWRPDWTSFASYMDALEKTGKTLNVVTQIGHGTVRKAVLGMETRSPDPGELKRMQSLVAEALDAGARGFSSGLSMTPGIFTMTSEVIALASGAGKRGLTYSTHSRDSGGEGGAGLYAALEEALEVGRRTGAKVQVSHLKCTGSTRGTSAKLLRRIEEAREEGVNVAADQYPYIAASGQMSGNVYPRWAVEGSREKALERARDAELRAKIKAHLTTQVTDIGGFDRLMVASHPVEPKYQGMSIPDVAKDMGCEPAEALVRLFERYDTHLIIFGMAEADVNRIAAHPLVAVASDGNSLKTTGPLSAGNPHPRSYGTYGRFLRLMVRERKLVSLEEAVRKMTSLPAERIGLTRRGRIAPGYFADVAVFNGDAFTDRATFTQPHQYSLGMEHVLVNGKPVVSHGKPNGATPGRLVRLAGE